MRYNFYILSSLRISCHNKLGEIVLQNFHVLWVCVLVLVSQADQTATHATWQYGFCFVLAKINLYSFDKA